MFEPLRAMAGGLQGPSWPTPQAFNALAAQHGASSGGGQPLQFIAPAGAAAPGAADYELAIHDQGRVPLRDANWHDFFNALAWLTFPRTKAALNRSHAAELQAVARNEGNNGRNVKRDALTLFDESGVLVLSRDPGVLARIRAFEWKQLFWTERERLMRTTQFLLFGHGLYEKALAPYVGMTGHALLLEVPDVPEGPSGLEGANLRAADALASALVQTIGQPRDLSPLPVLGVPGWFEANQRPGFYDNSGYFRPRRAR